MTIQSHIENIISEAYSIGRLKRFQRNTRGCVNETFTAETVQKGRLQRYFVKLYAAEAPEEKIQYEIALLKELECRGFAFSPRVIPAKDGQYRFHISRRVESVRREGRPDADPAGRSLAVMSFLEGTDRYDWDEPVDSPEDLTQAAQVLAGYHGAVSGWKRTECPAPSRFAETLSGLVREWRLKLKHGDAAFVTAFEEAAPFLRKYCSRWADAAFVRTYDRLPRLAIHGDFHPGNIKYADAGVTGMFDFDWSAFDARIFDTGIAVMYFCTEWKRRGDRFRPDKAERFISAYQETAAESGGIGPLTGAELYRLPDMILLSYLYLLNWVIEDKTGQSAGGPPRTHLHLLTCAADQMRRLENQKELLRDAFRESEWKY